MAYSTRDLDRFWSKVTKTDTCWLWTRARNNKGYGVFRVGDSLQLAHRVSWTALVGDPGGVKLDHRCHTPLCVRPDHLRLVTQKQNLEHWGPNSNSKSGVRGVSRKGNRWVVQVYSNYRRVYFGSFVELADAEAAAITQRNALFTHNDGDR